MGVLYLVATPIGNLEDITLRALRLLREVQLIAAEDTRHTRKLLTRYDIHTRLISYHEYNKLARLETILAALTEGDVALVSDAGTPGISDPGYELVGAALAAGFQVTPIPGPVAAIAGLVASGLPTGQFIFLGFLTPKRVRRLAELDSLRHEPRTLVLYEAPHRLLKTLTELQGHLGDRQAVACCELTKLYEQYVRGRLSALHAHYTIQVPRGEFTLIVAGAESVPQDSHLPNQPEASASVSLEERLQGALASGESKRTAAATIGKEFGLNKKAVYRMLVAAEEMSTAPT